ncbi:MAG TPA: SPOR domain-containing protein [Candidatus Omnitrophica bacterium]|nr:SPOR domain-containing protein [Candidatus Omnitrophota bacterium]
MAERNQLSLFQEPKKERKRITFSVDKLYIFSILLVLSLVISFSLGVERGKAIRLKNSPVKEDKNVGIIKKDIKIHKPQLPQENKSLKIKEAPKEDIKEKEIFYSIQLATYTKKEIAEAEAKKLKRKGLNPLLLKKGKYLVLCVGKFRTKEEAKNLLANLKKRYTDCFLRKL